MRSIPRQLTGKGARLQGQTKVDVTTGGEHQEFKDHDSRVVGLVLQIHVRGWNTSPVGIKTMSSYTKQGLHILRHLIKIKDY